MPEGPTDIIVTTHNRLDCLKRTLKHIYERTRADYRLHVIDDGSEEGNADFLIGEWRAGRVHHLLLRRDRRGAMAALNAGAWLSFSDPVVFTDDDVLCPDVEPCWLSRLLDGMSRHPELAMLALRHPGAKVKPVPPKLGDITYCKSLGGTFLAMRRKFLLSNLFPQDGRLDRPMEPRCKSAHKARW